MSAWTGWTTTSKSCRKGRTAVIPNRHGSAHIEFPNELDVLITREVDAPIALVFDVMTKPEHVSKWGVLHPDRTKDGPIALRVGGPHPHVFVAGEGIECSFRGPYLEVEPPIRTVKTWLYSGWPDAASVE